MFYGEPSFAWFRGTWRAKEIRRSTRSSQLRPTSLLGLRRSLQKLPRPVVVDCGVADVTEDGAQAMRSMCARVGGGCELDK